MAVRGVKNARPRRGSGDRVTWSQLREVLAVPISRRISRERAPRCAN